MGWLGGKTSKLMIPYLRDIKIFPYWFRGTSTIENRKLLFWVLFLLNSVRILHPPPHTHTHLHTDTVFCPLFAPSTKYTHTCFFGSHFSVSFVLFELSTYISLPPPLTHRHGFFAHYSPPPAHTNIRQICVGISFLFFYFTSPPHTLTHKHNFLIWFVCHFVFFQYFTSPHKIVFACCFPLMFFFYNAGLLFVN